MLETKAVCLGQLISWSIVAMLQGIVVRMCSQANYTTQVSMSTGLHLLALWASRALL